MDTPIIELSGLTKRYGQVTAVDHLDLTIRKSEVFGLLGPNGAGKSTTILMILGLTEPTAGTVRVCGLDPATSPVEVKRRVGYLPDDVGFYENRSGLENLIYTARLNRIPRPAAVERALEILDKVGLGTDGLKRTGTFSRGMRQRLGLADVLIKEPEVIILDEPTLGIDPVGVREFLDLIVRLSREQGITVLLSSHHLHQVQQVCDRVGLFVAGRLLAAGDIPSLSARLFHTDPYVIEAGIADPTQDHVLALHRALGEIGDITTVRLTGDVLYIGSTRDTSAQVAQALVRSGCGLTHLHKKSFGLDDIYNRYFQGGAVHEN